MGSNTYLTQSDESSNDSTSIAFGSATNSNGGNGYSPNSAGAVSGGTTTSSFPAFQATKRTSPVSVPITNILRQRQESISSNGSWQMISTTGSFRSNDSVDIHTHQQQIQQQQQNIHQNNHHSHLGDQNNGGGAHISSSSTTATPNANSLQQDSLIDDGSSGINNMS